MSRRTLFAASLSVATGILLGCAGKEVDPECSCIDTSTWFDSLEISSTVDRSQSFQAVVQIPGGCTEFDRIAQYRQGDTLFLQPTFKLTPSANKPGVACAHGPYPYNTTFALDPARSVGSRWIRYPLGTERSVDRDSLMTISVTVR
jgi:hypothetical protein